MATEVILPKVDMDMDEGTLSAWHVAEGAAVTAGQPLFDIETDKAAMEVEAPATGVLRNVTARPGDRLPVGTVIAWIAAEGETVGTVPAPQGGAPAAAASMAAAPAPAATDGEGGAVPTAIEAVGTAASATAEAAPRSEAGASGIRATPAARRAAQAAGLALAALHGSGPRGRIQRADVEAAAVVARAAPPPVAAAATAPSVAPVLSTEAVRQLLAGRAYEEVPLDSMRRTIAARLGAAKQSIPHFYLHRTVQIDALLALREQLNTRLAARGGKLSLNDLIIKASALALQAVPEANAVWAEDRIFRLKPSDIAVAVSVEGGLFTPVLRDAEAKSLSALSAEMRALAARARDRKLAPQEYQGGSFALSNLGMFGVDSFEAIISPPHGAILAVGAARRQPVLDAQGEFAKATVLKLALSVDHRVIDGALGARLLGAIAGNLEDPMAMIA